MASDGGELLELQCPICYGEQNEAGFTTLLCGHVFHETCLKKSLRLKAQCPTCRCPAKPTDPKCVCKTGQPIRLFHLQRPRSGADVPSQLAAGAIAADDAVTAAALAAVEQRAAHREGKLREALQLERQRVSELELEVAQKETEVEKEQAKAERRKQRLAAMEKEHQATTTRLVEDKSRLEAREREQSEELNRTRQALHKMRMDLEKTRAALYEREEAVMRLKREVAMQRARAGGAAALQPREMAELLGERKEDWQMVYSMKVEELRQAMDSTAELKAALAKAATDADARVAAERLAGAEKIKAVTQERDEAKRELMDLEYKLHEAERRGVQLQSRSGAAAAAATVAGPGAFRTSAPGAPKAPFVAGPAGLPPRVAAAQVLPQAARPPVPFKDQAGFPPGSLSHAQPDVSQLGRLHHIGASAQHDQTDRNGAGSRSRRLATELCLAKADNTEHDDDGDLDALATMAMSCAASEDEADADAEGRVDAEAGPLDRRLEAGRAWASGKRDRSAAGEEEDIRGTRDVGAGVISAGDMPYDASGEEDLTPSGKRLCHGPAQDEDRGGGSAGGGHVMDTAEEAFDLAELDEDPEPVPVLPRAFSGIFTGGPRGQPAVKPAAVLGQRAVLSPPGSVLGGGPSFAAKAGASSGALGGPVAGARGGGRLIIEGPDGRGGTTRFPLTSSFGHNALRVLAGSAKGAISAGRSSVGSGRGNGPGKQQPVAASGRIDAFLRPLAQPNRR